MKSLVLGVGIVCLSALCAPVQAGFYEPLEPRGPEPGSPGDLRFTNTVNPNPLPENFQGNAFGFSLLSADGKEWGEVAAESWARVELTGGQYLTEQGTTGATAALNNQWCGFGLLGWAEDKKVRFSVSEACFPL